MTTTIVHLIAGARPNFMKIAPLYRLLKLETWCTPVFVHTGQHYDYEMSEALMNELKLPVPEVNLGVGSGSHGEQTGRTMIEYERFCLRNRPDWIIVPGDVNSTLACALVGKKLGVKIAHLEAGLRSNDLSMPEEINRRLTDVISDVLWTPCPEADLNLHSEGIAAEQIECVGNIMIDSLELLRDDFTQLHFWKTLKLPPQRLWGGNASSSFQRGSP